jgi:undecaprenyl phosphate-alpha-L-ara4N flippase subunit ArnE
MWKIIILSTIQSLLFCGGQVYLKLAMERMSKFSMKWAFFSELLTNWHLILSGICMLLGTALWMYILKYFDFSIAYPITSISYIFGMLAAMFVFHEAIPLIRWLGVLLIMVGVVFIVK